MTPDDDSYTDALYTACLAIEAERDSLIEAVHYLAAHVIECHARIGALTAPTD